MLVEKPAPLSYTRFTTITLLIAAIVAGLIAASRYTPHFVTSAAPAKTFDNPRPLVDEVQQARTDMLVHALEHGMAVEAETELGSMAFDDEWKLYYAAVVTAEGTVTLLTAVNKDEPRIRYTASWDAQNGYATPWMPVLR